MECRACATDADAGGSGPETAELLALIRRFAADGYEPSRSLSEADDVYDLRWEIETLNARRRKREALRRLRELDERPHALRSRNYDEDTPIGPVLFRLTRQELVVGEPVDTIHQKQHRVFRSTVIESTERALGIRFPESVSHE